MDEKSLMPLIVQDAGTKQVLSLYYCNSESIALMKESGFVWRYSRKQGKQMKVGASSGNVQNILSLTFDCDMDALLATVAPEGKSACHTGNWSCFSIEMNRQWGFLDALISTIKTRKEKTSQYSYVSSIVSNAAMISEKLLEEAAELAEAIEQKPKSEVIWEAADLFFFTLVALENRSVDFQEVIDELKRRKNNPK